MNASTTPDFSLHYRQVPKLNTYESATVPVFNGASYVRTRASSHRLHGILYGKYLRIGS